MNLRATLSYLKKKDATSVAVAILVALSLINLLQVGALFATQLSAMLYATVDGAWASLGTYFGRSFVQQVFNNVLVTICMIGLLELVLRGWIWYKVKK